MATVLIPLAGWQRVRFLRRDGTVLDVEELCPTCFAAGAYVAQRGVTEIREMTQALPDATCSGCGKAASEA